MSRAMTSIVLAALAVAVGSGCTSRGEAPPPCGEDYGTCSPSFPCGGGATCESFSWRYGSGSMCTRGCDDELDCPRSGGRAGRCISVNRDGRFACFIDCASPSDCPDGWVCQPIQSSGVVSGICLP
jgi:hypothetical protein